MPFWPFRRTKPQPSAAPPLPRGTFLTHAPDQPGYQPPNLPEIMRRLEAALPRLRHPDGTAMDDNSNGMPAFKGMVGEGVPMELVGWFTGMQPLGPQMCAMIAQNWLVDKALHMPARDAIRHGWDVHVGGLELPEGSDIDAREAEIVERIKERDKEFRLRHNLHQFVAMGRLFGIRVLLFRVESDDPNYYEKPFNLDGVTPGSYRGMSQVDPYWCIPELDTVSLGDPASPHFYEPTYWVINGKRYHRTHVCIFRASDVPDILKPRYQYGGIPVPQRILERVYAAERTANEGPQLAMTKRLTVWNTDLAALYGNQEEAARHMREFTQYRDNYGVKLVDSEDTMAQFDTSLADLDATIMTQYQLVAAAAGVPATKLLGTTPKGFNATGEYEESNYHEELETIQANDLTAVTDRHYALLLRSEIEPEEGLAPGTLTANVDWAPVDSPTAKEYAEINKINAETDTLLANVGAIDGMDSRNRVKIDPNSNYTGIADPEPEPLDDIINEVLGNGPTDPTAPYADPAEVGAGAGRSGLPGNPPIPPVTPRT